MAMNEVHSLAKVSITLTMDDGVEYVVEVPDVEAFFMDAAWRTFDPGGPAYYTNTPPLAVDNLGLLSADIRPHRRFIGVIAKEFTIRMPEATDA